MNTDSRLIYEAYNSQVRVCAHCVKELEAAGKPLPFTPEQQKNFSHGICKRHSLEMANQMPGQSREMFIAKINSKPPEAFCPDLSQDAVM